MRKILVTGGTTFVSRYCADWFVRNGDEVYVLNRNTRPQVSGVRLIEADRHALKNQLKDLHFDAVFDVTAYDAEDIGDLCQALGDFGQYVMISSSAVYPETGVQPLTEETPAGPNRFWGKYGTDKIAAENMLRAKIPDAYILRPPYLYGPMNNVYREAFVFDCARSDRRFFLPRDGSMRLQFFHVRDLCRLMETLISQRPADHILNVGNARTVTVRDWVTACYACLGKIPTFKKVYDGTEQRKYFSFYDYEYILDVRKQAKICPETVSLQDGLRESLVWYAEHETDVNKKPYREFIDGMFRN